MVSSRHIIDRRRKRISTPVNWILFIFYLIITFLLSYRMSGWAWDKETQALLNDNVTRARLLASHLENKLQKGIIASSLNAKSQTLINLINKPTTENTNLANQYLTESNQKADAGVSYIMNAQGTTLASSNWNKPNSFVGKNYSFRPYFSEAKRGTESHYTALGVTSGKLGYYYASPIIKDGQVIGVTVVKTNLSSKELLLHTQDADVIITDENDVIVLATRNQWKLRTFSPIDDLTMKQIIESRQYAGASLAPINIRKSEKQPEHGLSVELGQPDSDLTAFSSMGDFLQTDIKLKDQHWTLHAFMNIREANDYALAVAVISVLACTTVFLLLRIFIGFKSNIEELQQISSRDALTGLYTRRHMIDAGIAKIEASQSDLTHNFSIAMIDVDHFKKINDKFGHQSGDQVLREISKTIKSGLQDDDLAVRYGGEEFVIIFSPESTSNDLETVKKIQQHVRRLHFSDRLRDIRLSISAGLAHYNRNESFDDILARADALLYEAKRSGRDQVFSDNND